MNLDSLVIPAIDAWKKTRPPGGPDNFLPLATKKELFWRLLAQIFSQAEIQDMWQKIEPKLTQPQTTEIVA